MLDIELFRENPEKIKKSEKRRDRDPSRVDEVVEIDEEWRETLEELENLRQEKNEVSERIAELKQEGEDAEDEIEKVNEINNRIEELEEKEQELKEERDEARYRIGNLVHESVPKGEDEDDNVELRTWEPDKGRSDDGELSADVLEENDLIETGKATEVAGDRAYYLKRDLVKLNWALQQFAMDLLVEKGYVPHQTPYALEKEVMEAAAELEDFHEQLYKLEREERYLIATSEQTLAALQFDEIIEPGELPLKYAGFSTNFRREAGKHGTQTRGIWRVHQFEKIEQFIFCDPENSWELHEELLDNAEEVMQELELPYRVVNVCTGDLGDTPAKKYDIEVWRPPLQEYGEVVSCSNCTSYQARKLGTRIRRSGDNETAHTLNATALATSRIISAIVENHQSDRGIEIPDALQPYFGKERIEF